MVNRVSERGQITIDRDVRRQLGVRPGMIAYQRVIDGCLEVVFLPAAHHRSLYGVFHREGDHPAVGTADDLEDAVMEAVADELSAGVYEIYSFDRRFERTGLTAIIPPS